jgi:hypothetical protein
VSSPADRQKSYRQRRDRGEIVLPITISDVAVCEALVAAGFLDPMHKDDRQALARAIERVIETLALRDA